MRAFPSAVHPWLIQNGDQEDETQTNEQALQPVVPPSNGDNFASESDNDMILCMSTE